MPHATCHMPHAPQATEARVRWRVAEIRTVLRVLRSLDDGWAPPGLRLSCCPDLAGPIPKSPLKPPAASSSADAKATQQAAAPGWGQPAPCAFFRGRLDLSRVAAAGHSYGGATAALAASELPEFGAVVAHDPWW